MDAPKLVNGTRRLFTIALALLLPLCLSPGTAWAQKPASETGTLAQGGSPALASQDDAQDLPSKFDLRSVDTDGDDVGDRCYVTPVRCQYNTTKGTAKIIVTDKGNFKGTKTISFKIS